VTDVRSDVAHLFRRAGFGASPAQLDEAVAAGYEATVDALVSGAGAPSDPTADKIALPTFAPYQAPTKPADAPQNQPKERAQRKTERLELAPLQAWWFNRMIVSSVPLREKITLMWHGHFATGVSKVRDPYLMYLQNQRFRTLGAGSFEALTQVVAKDGAMMIWLDTQEDKKRSPNQNFARELMERFTIGVGNYGQDDVTQAARCFTGWEYDRATNQWREDARQHDDGIKTFLGETGNFDGENVVSIILSKPASAQFVVSSVWSALAYPVKTNNPVVADLLPTYSEAYDISDLLRATFLHPDFLSPAARGGLVKQPIEYLAGAARALGLDADLQPLDAATGLPPASSPAGTRKARVTLATLSTAMAQTPFNPTNVGGWPPNGYWLNTATALARIRACELMVERGDISVVDHAPVSQRVAAAAELLGVVDGWGSTTETALTQATGDPAQLMVLAMSAPEYVLN
jgi:uncharacterized protein (DUF1800 family)